MDENTFFERLDCYVTYLIQSIGINYVCENFICIRETYYENRYGG